MAMAAVLLVVVIVIVGAGAYFAFNSSGQPTTASTQTCQPKNSAGCGAFSTTHDLGLLVPLHAAQTGTPIPFTVTHPSNEVPSSFKINFGDGSAPFVGTNPTADHVYTSAGQYVVAGSALIGSTWHDSLRGLVTVSITASYAAVGAGDLPGVLGTVLANSSTASGATTLIHTNGFVTVSGSYSAQPTNPAWTSKAPSLQSSGGTSSGLSSSSSSASGTFTYSANGTYTITFVGSSSSGSSTQYQNFTWTVIVGNPGDPLGVAGAGAARSPHPGQLVVYELAPGGATSLDPAVDYETVGYETILNVYETLISYNGSQTGPTYGSYIPNIATCVPGSPLCNTLYPGTNSLITTNGQYYTFVISKSAHFYDPATKASWNVYPTDVLFSVARTMGFADLPCSGCNNGWILTQALLPSPPDPSWDGGIHAPYNNTPGNIFGSVLVNASAYCPSTAMSQDNGCVTFNVHGGGIAWPYFLELIADTLGGGIVSCGWASASTQAQAIPGWTEGAISGSGDQPCKLPGGATSSDSSAFTAAVAAMAPTAWDGWEKLSSGFLTGSYPGHVTDNMVGSGPYYLAGYQIGQSYTLAASPGYQKNPNCLGSGCNPAPGGYARSVSVIWETSATQGEQAYAAGVADFASIPGTDLALLLQLIQQGKVNAISFPTITINFFPFDLNFNLQGARSYDTNPITVPTDFMSSVGMRQFLVHAYPYDTIQRTIQTQDGIQFGFNYGGAIPQFMANYYPADVPWPSGDPITDPTVVGGAAWWWAQISNPSSQYYDPEVAGCTTSNPCEFPFFGQNGAPGLDQRLALFASEVNTLSGGKLRMDVIDINFIDAVINSLFSPPGGNAMPFYRLGWAPDYPDPTDYVLPMYQPDATYTHGDAVLEQLSLSAYNQSGCSTDYNYYANLTTALSSACQGAAYIAMNHALQLAAVAPGGPGRVMLYDLASHIANQLALYLWYEQNNVVVSYAAWIDGSTINSNVTIGGGDDIVWFSLAGNGVVS
jgi:peptide/nickel transport system substrate-binding protein